MFYTLSRILLADLKVQQMSESDLQAVRDILSRCSPDERERLFRELLKEHHVHEYEKVVGASAEMILEAVHRAPELTRRMLRGVIADAAFAFSVVPSLNTKGWKDITEVGNFAYDYKLDDGKGPIRIQVKLQRSEKCAPLVKGGAAYGQNADVFIVEVQKTRTGLVDRI